MSSPLLSNIIRGRRYVMALPYITGHILDIGCGHAYLADLVPHREDYVGVDINPALLVYGEQRYPQYRFYTTDLETQALPPEVAHQRFDTISLIALLEHLSKPAHILNQLAALLGPQGRVVATTPTPLGHRVHRLGAQLGLFYREAAEDHKCVLDGAALKQLFQAAGLRVARYQQFEFGCNQLIVGELPTE
jgi:2-polyprenyl-3-methyl-5-hydroxy-6-metoxy-1,4-benzoquinol methylase